MCVLWEGYGIKIKISPCLLQLGDKPGITIGVPMFVRSRGGAWYQNGVFGVCCILGARVLVSKWGFRCLLLLRDGPGIKMGFSMVGNTLGRVWYQNKDFTMSFAAWG